MSRIDDPEAGHRRQSDGPIIPPAVVMYNKEMQRQQRMRNNMALRGCLAPPSPHSGCGCSPNRSGNKSPRNNSRPSTPCGPRNTNGARRPPALASWENTKPANPRRASTSVTSPNNTTLPSILVNSPKSRSGTGLGRSLNNAPPTPNLRRSNSFQVLVPGAAQDATPIPASYFVSFCHQCYRFGCDRRRPDQTGDNTACPSCRHKPLEVPATRSGLLKAYSTAARQHKADPFSTATLQAMMSLHYCTHARVILFRSMTSTTGDNTSSTSQNSSGAPGGSKVAYSFRTYAANSAGAMSKCVVCLLECGYGEKPVVKLETCGHLFHAACVKSWVEERNVSCPMCRAPMIERD